MQRILLPLVLGALWVAPRMPAQVCAFTGPDSAEMSATENLLTLQRAEKAVEILRTTFREQMSRLDSAARPSAELYQIVYPNQLNFLQGYVLKQEVTIRRKQVELLDEQRRSGHATPAQVSEARAGLQQAKDKFCTFVRTARWPE